MSKILVADDEEKVCWAFEQFLNAEGHSPLIASNAQEALEKDAGGTQQGADARAHDHPRQPDLDDDPAAHLVNPASGQDGQEVGERHPDRAQTY